MKKGLWFIVFMVMSLLLASCGPTVDEAKTQFCNDMKELGVAIQNAKALDANSTVDQTKEAQKQIEQAWDKVTKSAAQLKEVQLDATEDAYKEVKKTIDGISDDATLKQASATVKTSVAAFDVAYTAINTTVCTK